MKTLVREIWVDRLIQPIKVSAIQYIDFRRCNGQPGCPMHAGVTLPQFVETFGDALAFSDTGIYVVCK